MTSRQSDVPRFRRLLAALLYLGLLGRPPDSKDGIGADFGCTASRGTQLVDDGLKLAARGVGLSPAMSTRRDGSRLVKP